MRTINTREYLSTLCELVSEGKEVSVTVTGNSMSPFLIHHRDRIIIGSPERDLRRGDMVFFVRDNGQYVVHRIRRVRADGYYLIGDGQTETEGPIARSQIFAIVKRVNRKGRWMGEGDFWWLFFQKVWIRMVPLRRYVVKLYSLVYEHRL